MDTAKQVEESSRVSINLERVTIVVALGEALAALTSGILAGSVALVAFGTDSLIEMASALVVLAQLRSASSGVDPRPGSMHRAHRSIAFLFFALAIYVTLNATYALVRGYRPAENVLGVVVCLASATLMPVLALKKRRASRQLALLGHHSVARILASDANETALCAVLSLSTLGGIGLTWWLGWWWADASFSLVIVVFALREGREAWLCED